MISSGSPIVVLDSGLGGLTVVRAIRITLPSQNILYFGDTARVPYGSKSAATVTSFVRQIITYLSTYEPKHVVIACNTATALSLKTIQEEFPHLSISGVVEPGAKAAAEASGAGAAPVIGVIGTEATIRSGAYEREIIKYRPDARILCHPTPLLASIVEEGREDNDPLVILALEQYLKPLVQRGVQTLVLGCTHYPVYRGLIERIVGEEVAVIDSADKCAQDVRRILLADGKIAGDDKPKGFLKCFVTDDSPRFARLARRFLDMELDAPVWVSPDELHALSASPLAN
jgi:glutamate racemase